MWHFMSTSVHILVVDDNYQNLVATEALLARSGVTVLTAACGREAGQQPALAGHELAARCRLLADEREPPGKGQGLAPGTTVSTVTMPRQAAPAP
jgi:CheY-like chemotaxis protein